MRFVLPIGKQATLQSEASEPVFGSLPHVETIALGPFKNLAAVRSPKAGDTTAGFRDYEATLTLTAMFLPPSSRYVTSALALTLSLPSMAVFLSMKNVMVLGSACCVSW